MAEFNATLTNRALSTNAGEGDKAEAGLYASARAYHALGYSLIPVGESKRPGVSWKVYQERQPSAQELYIWFERRRFHGLGIVTGSVSGLAVLDFDTVEAVHDFMQAHPELAQTRVALSGGRGLPHFYYRLPEGLAVPSRAGPGVDWLAEGRYVVAPPTPGYQVVEARVPKRLTAAEVERISAFVAGQTRSGATAASRPVRAALAAAEPPLAAAAAGTPGAGWEVDEAGLHACYQRHLGQGRNQALFRAACLARDSGWSQEAASLCLLGLHVSQPSPPGHRRETPAQRQAEALATLGSAFSQPPRPANASRFPNTLREHLLAHKDGALTLRLLEVLSLKGLAGHALTEAELCQHLRGFLSRPSIRVVLRATYPDSSPIFVRFPPHTPPDGADTCVSTHKKTNAFLSIGKNLTKLPASRPPARYRLPTLAELCAAFDVPRRPGDPLTLADLRTSRTYRQALHRELIRRRPGQYGQVWLGARLGVCDRTIRYYHTQMPISSAPNWLETPLVGLDSLAHLPTFAQVRAGLVDVGGQCLIAHTGKTYPLYRELAQRLFRQGRRLSILRRVWNSYWYGSRPPPDLPPPTPLQVTGRPPPLPGAGQAIPTSSAPPSQPSVPPAQAVPLLPALSAPAVPQPAAQTPPRPHRTSRFFTRPLPSRRDEDIAAWAHRVIPAFSRPNARRLVECFGADCVEKAIRHVWVLMGKGIVRKPAGLLITQARLYWRETHPNDEAPVFKGQPDGRRAEIIPYVPPEQDPLAQSPRAVRWRIELALSMEDGKAYHRWVQHYIDTFGSHPYDLGDF